MCAQLKNHWHNAVKLLASADRLVAVKDARIHTTRRLPRFRSDRDDRAERSEGLIL